jgi:hypothetical protein
MSWMHPFKLIGVGYLKLIHWSRSNGFEGCITLVDLPIGTTSRLRGQVSIKYG